MPEYIIKQEGTLTRVTRYWRQDGGFVLSREQATRFYNRPYAEVIAKLHKIKDAVIEEVN